MGQKRYMYTKPEPDLFDELKVVQSHIENEIIRL
jgi:hypothetical protein